MPSNIKSKHAERSARRATGRTTWVGGAGGSPKPFLGSPLHGLGEPVVGRANCGTHCADISRVLCQRGKGPLLDGLRAWECGHAQWPMPGANCRIGLWPVMVSVCIVHEGLDVTSGLLCHHLFGTSIGMLLPSDTSGFEDGDDSLLEASRDGSPPGGAGILIKADERKSRVLVSVSVVVRVPPCNQNLRRELHTSHTKSETYRATTEVGCLGFTAKHA